MKAKLLLQVEGREPATVWERDVTPPQIVGGSDLSFPIGEGDPGTTWRLIVAALTVEVRELLAEGGRS